MNQVIITEKDLLAATGYKRRAQLEKCLRSFKVSFHFGKGGQIWTTIDALNASLGLKQNNPDSDLDFA